MRAAIGVMAAVVLSSSCFLSGGETDAGAELAALAERATTATYSATYRFELSGPLAPAVTTRLEIVQDPPVVIRKLETSTPGEPEQPVTVRHWQATTEDGNFVCTDYAEVGVQCLPNPVAGGTFGSAQVDVFFDQTADLGAFSSVQKANRTFRIAGEEATCFEAVPAVPTATPEDAERQYRFELCFASNGVLLRGRRAPLEPSEGDERRETLVEAVDVSGNVDPADLRLPGPVLQPEDL